MKEITTSNFSFESLRKGNALYVDKTQYVWSLVNSEENIYFLSRPRRFGKSLLLSTLEAFFLNKRELFRGLAIDTLAPDDEWQEWPVIHLDMAQATLATSYTDLEKMLYGYIADVARSYGMTVEKEELAPAVFRRLINFLYDMTGKEVVILIDEYDKPILDSLHTDYVDKVVELMQGFYQTVKSQVAKERFVLITGVTKFAHTSLFSGANNPTDITQRTGYAAMLGYTEQELRDNFAEYIDASAEKIGMDRETLIAKMKEWYDGFRFTSSAVHVFNPVSVGKFFQNDSRFENYWYATGTPTFLIQLMRNNPFKMEEYTKEWRDPVNLPKSDAISLDPLSMAVQTGYLTIKDVSYEFGEEYRYDFPNEEIRLSWTVDMSRIAFSGNVSISGERRNILMALRDGNTDRLMERLQWMFAGVTKENIGEVNEGYYRNLIYMIFTAMGVTVHSEEQVAGGRIDVIVCGYGSAYVMELKVSKTGKDSDVEKLLDKGIDQALTKHYADKYRLEGNTIHVVSAVFEHEHNQLVAWKEV